MPDTEKPDREEQQDAKRRLPMKMMVVVASIMLLEGAGVFLFVTMTGGGAASAVAVEGGDEADRESTVEILLCKDRYQNMSTNRLWRWDAEVYMKVRKKNEPFVTETMEHRAAEIQAGLAQIFRSAQHSHLKEPELKTITRQLTAYVNEIFGEDPDGMPRVDRVMITTLNGLPTDG